jgi:hypothetical protein
MVMILAIVQECREAECHLMDLKQLRDRWYVKQDWFQRANSNKKSTL